VQNIGCCCLPTDSLRRHSLWTSDTFFVLQALVGNLRASRNLESGGGNKWESHELGRRIDWKKIFLPVYFFELTDSWRLRFNFRKHFSESLVAREKQWSEWLRCLGKCHNFACVEKSRAIKMKLVIVIDSDDFIVAYTVCLIVGVLASEGWCEAWQPSLKVTSSY